MPTQFITISSQCDLCQSVFSTAKEAAECETLPFEYQFEIAAEVVFEDKTGMINDRGMFSFHRPYYLVIVDGVTYSISEQALIEYGNAR